jgi:FkbM family methyltransferase
MTSKLSRLSGVLRGRRAEEKPGKNWKVVARAYAVRIEELERTIASLEQRLQRSRLRHAAVETRLHSRRSATPSPAVLRQVLGVRATHLPVTADERRAARAREMRLCEVCPEYTAVVDVERAEVALQQVSIEGFAWWVPLDPRVEDRTERAERQGFPLRAILQTREVALGGVMLDIGANLGRTSIPRVLLGDARAVYAAEPFPANFAALVRNVAHYGLRGFVLPDQVAIGETRTAVELRVSRFPGGHRVLRKRRRPVETVSVEQWPLDAWIDRLGIERDAITFVKVDTQGSEVGVLRGSESLLARPHVSWQVEVDPVLLKRAGTPLRELIKLIQGRFTHFIDIGNHQPGPRSRSVQEAAEALAYVGSEEKRTDLLLYHSAV